MTIRNPRVPIAIVGGLIGFLIYVIAVVTLGDNVLHAHVLVQFAYYLFVGSVWVLPVRWLMLWSVHKR